MALLVMMTVSLFFSFFFFLCPGLSVDSNYLSLRYDADESTDHTTSLQRPPSLLNPILINSFRGTWEP